MNLLSALQMRMDNKTKPIGSLGKLESIAIQAGLIQQSLHPVIQKATILLFAGDHGIAATGLVNPFPQEVTAQMVQNFVQEGAAINVLCRENNILLRVADAGVNADFDPDLPIKHCKIAKGTRNYLHENAMQPFQVYEAFKTGAELVKQIHAEGCNTLGIGEMGIGNSSSAALLMHQLCGFQLEDCIGMGTGHSTDHWLKKAATLQQVCDFHSLGKRPFPVEELLCRVGGFEIAMMTGAYLEGWKQNMVLVVDGFIATAALLCAHQINPDILSHCIFAHTSGEKGHAAMLEYLKVKPLLDLNMRLGEGTGAALAIPLIKNAVAILSDMASFQSAGITKNE
jgi:nicotinate-nucleotide--dimethylbenzimidazole phosphoribosyltransferase